MSLLQSPLCSVLQVQKPEDILVLAEINVAGWKQKHLQAHHQLLSSTPDGGSYRVFQ